MHTLTNCQRWHEDGVVGLSNSGKYAPMGAARLEPARPCAERHVRFEAGACPRGVWRLASLGRPLSPPGVSAGVQRLGDTQRQRQPLLAHQEPRRVRPQCTPIGGGQREQEALRQALAAA